MTARYRDMSQVDKEAHLDGLPEQMRHVADHLEDQFAYLQWMVAQTRQARFREPAVKSST